MARRPRTRGPEQAKFHTRLVLNQWAWSLFGLDTTDGYLEHEGRRRPVLEVFKEKFQINAHTAEGLVPDDNSHHFLHAMLNRPEPILGLTEDELRQYDQHIVRHTARLNEPRERPGLEPIRWKYFQWLTLLFTEVYLDRYFRDPDGLRDELNAHIDRFNEDRHDVDAIERFDDAGEARVQLNKLAFWSATGSGKTLMMHIHLLQYQHYLEKHGRRRDLNRIILLTPNEGLSNQHWEEFQAAGIQAELFSKEGRGLFAGHSVEILDIHKLAEEGKQKTISFESFESNNLVLIDEGHRGASSGEEGTWMRFRNALCEKGFSFEYSATFGQAIKGARRVEEPEGAAAGKKKLRLEDIYGRAILFDYSYRFFYGDGYGKDYHILNLDEDTEERQLEPYLTACLLAFFEQQRLHRVTGEPLKPFNIAKPLLIFVGGSVNAVRTQNRRQVSDVTQVLLFLAAFLSDGDAAATRIDEILADGLISANRRNIFAGLFRHLRRSGKLGRELYAEMLRQLFNAEGGGALHIDYLKGQEGEIALRVGESDPFGVINVGDAKKLADLCDTYDELHVHEKEFGESLFDGLNDAASTVHMLVGSKKFSEGWNSWRVSTMGLMNIGSTEGSQIIQLFGRGVRLRGWQGCLRRSSHADLPPDVRRPDDLGLLETLNVFGVRANYMAEFRRYLEEEGLPPNDQPQEILLPVIKTQWYSPLKTLKLKEQINGVSTRYGDPFKRFGPIPTLRPPDADPASRERYLFDHRVILNWYPRVKAVRARGIATDDDRAQLHSTTLSAQHVALLDLDTIYFEMLRFKAERGWNNLNITRRGIADLLARTDWYALQIPASEMAFESFERVFVWQEIAVSLLKKYCERYYTFRKREWELPHLEYQLLASGDPNFTGYSDSDEDHFYRVLVDQSRDDIIADIERLKDAIESKNLTSAQFGAVYALWFDRHLYEPLLHLAAGGEITIQPVCLNAGERRFVDDLRRWHADQGDRLGTSELYLLRNRSRGGGVGFFEAGNFHPDFMLWIAQEGRQSLAFIDPKGLLNVGPEDPKVRFCDTIKEIEERLNESEIVLEAYLISTTPRALVRNRWNRTDEWLDGRHILFPDDGPNYLSPILDVLMGACATPAS